MSAPGLIVSGLRGLLAAAVAGLWLLAGGADARAMGFSDWAVVIVAGDWRSQTGTTQAFDNARRDLSEAFVKAGFRRENLRQFSLRPDRAGDDFRVVVAAEAVQDGFIEAARSARGGCLFYLTSHGTPEGAVYGPAGTLTPTGLDQLLTRACGPRPTVAIISACYSGVFVPVVSRPNRMILAAARADRSSFGCGEKNRYPYFDACVIETLPQSRDFLDLAVKARACVVRMEAETGMAPPSEPQVNIGVQAQQSLPPLRFAGP
jgi:hypothetical protein